MHAAASGAERSLHPKAARRRRGYLAGQPPRRLRKGEAIQQPGEGDLALHRIEGRAGRDRRREPPRQQVPTRSDQPRLFVRRQDHVIVLAQHTQGTQVADGVLHRWG